MGNHTFTVIAYDNRGGPTMETITVRVLPAGTPNGQPIAPADSATVDLGGSVNIMPAISDPDGDQVRITRVTGATLGFAQAQGATVLYSAVAGQTGTDTLTYTVTDARGATATGTITITVQ